MPPKYSKNDALQIEKISIEQNTVIVPQYEDIDHTLYLELLENKDTIKPELKNVEYIPEPKVINESIQQQQQQQQSTENQTKVKDAVLDNYRAEFEAAEEQNQQNAPYKVFDCDNDVFSAKSTTPHSIRSSRSNRHSKRPNMLERMMKRTKNDTPSRHDNKHKRLKISEKITEFVRDTVKDDDNEHSKHRHHNNNKPPPLLSEISKGNVPFSQRINRYTAPNVDPGAGELEKKRELLFKFHLLRKSYQECSLEKYSEQSDLLTMERDYDFTVRKLSLDSTLQSYKKYLLFGFMVIEFIMQNWFKFDMTGFSTQQMVQMNSYERLLVELGEKHYLASKSNYSVEIRLIGMILVNALTFIISKAVLKTASSSINNFLNNNSALNSAAKPAAAQNPTGRKMKGPQNFDVDELLKKSNASPQATTTTTGASTSKTKNE